MKIRNKYIHEQYYPQVETPDDLLINKLMPSHSFKDNY